MNVDQTPAEVPWDRIRYFDASSGRDAIKLLPGGRGVGRHEVLVTVVGTGVAVCLRDSATGIGGLLHLLESSAESLMSGEPDRCPLLDGLLAAMVSAGGGETGLQARLYGAAPVLGDGGAVASRTLVRARAWLAGHGIPVVAEDVAGPDPLKVYFQPDDGRVRLKRLRDIRNDTIIQRDRSHVGGDAPVRPEEARDP